MRVVLLAFVLTFTWAILAKETTSSSSHYSIVSAQVHSKAENILVLEVDSQKYGHESLWVFFEGKDHSELAQKILADKKKLKVDILKRQWSNVIHARNLKLFTSSKSYLGTLHEQLPGRSMKDHLKSIWKEGFVFFN